MRQRRTGALASAGFALAIASAGLLQVSMTASLFSSPVPPTPIVMPAAETRDRIRQAELREVYGTRPLAFEQNRGQADEKVRFLSRGDGYTLLLTATDAVLAARTDSRAG
jgi:hypothetical protein